MNTRSRSAATAASATAEALAPLAAHDHRDDRAVDAMALRLQSVSISFRSSDAVAAADATAHGQEEEQENLATFKRTIVALVNKVYTALGNAQLESTYQSALLLELRKLRGVHVANERVINILYDDEVVGTRRADLVVCFADGSSCILELKAVKDLTPEHLKQLKFYMWSFRVPHGVLINFPRVPGFPDIDDDVADDFTLHKLQGKTVLSNRNLRKHAVTFEPEIHYISNAKIVPPDAEEV